MSNLSVTIRDKEYPLATTLRVAYKIQGQHNHKPYAEVFRTMGDMPVEQQIGIMYASFECANPEESKFITRKVFEEYYLDNFNLKDLMNQLQGVIKGIMGEDFFEDAESENEDVSGATYIEGEEAKN